MATDGMIRRCLRALAAMLYPQVCEVCGKALVEGEHTLCLHCIADMPLFTTTSFADNEIHTRLMRVPIHRAAALYHYYRDTPHALLIQKAKYASRPALARRLGQLAARHLISQGFFDGIEAITIVPLHSSRRRRRGYNQSMMIARGVADVTSLPIVEMLHCSRHSTQTARTAIERWHNATSAYSALPGISAPGSSILLIDDVITTGATLSACSSALQSAHPDVSVSILAVGLASIK